MSDAFLSFISEIVPLTNEVKETIARKITVVSYPRKTILLREGEFYQHLYFVKKGILRTYVIRDTEEKTSLFFMENDFLVSSYRFVNEPSREYIEVVEDAELLEIKYDDLLESYDSCPEMNYVARVILERHFFRVYNRLISLLQLQAAERYAMLLKEQPDLFQRVPLSHIASYIGIRKESLSRIRRLLK